jgi:hypothetical protein
LDCQLPVICWRKHGSSCSIWTLFSLQANHAKQVKELLAAQEAVAKERNRLEALQEEIKAKRTELAAQVR